MGFPQRIDDEKFLRMLDEAQDEWIAEQQAKRQQQAEPTDDARREPNRSGPIAPIEWPEPSYEEKVAQLKEAAEFWAQPYVQAAYEQWVNREYWEELGKLTRPEERRRRLQEDQPWLAFNAAQDRWHVEQQAKRQQERQDHEPDPTEDDIARREEAERFWPRSDVRKILEQCNPYADIADREPDK